MITRELQAAVRFLLLVFPQYLTQFIPPPPPPPTPALLPWRCVSGYQGGILDESLMSISIHDLA